jgi:hypothetical protein
LEYEGLLYITMQELAKTPENKASAMFYVDVAHDLHSSKLVMDIVLHTNPKNPPI